MSTKYAFITGAASGVGQAITLMLVSKGIKVFITDRDEPGTHAVAEDTHCPYMVVNVTSWDSQRAAFSQAVSHFGRIDYVFPIAGIGENAWVGSPAPGVFEKPNLQVLDVNITGLMYTVLLGVQQLRRQEENRYGFRGKLIVAGSVCGVYCYPSLPIYATSKHAITGLIRSWGKSLPKEGITLNSFNPNVMRTGFATSVFYDMLEQEGLLTPLSAAVDACARLLRDNPDSGECCEIGPNYDCGQGLVQPKFAPLEDDAHIRVFKRLEERGEAKRYKL